MKWQNRILNKWLGLLALAAVCALGNGCHDDDDYDHDPPAGQGTIVVDNISCGRVQIFVEGTYLDSIRSGHIRYFDLPPGLYRVVLDAEDTRRAWAADVDVLDGRLTILQVRWCNGSFDCLDVAMYFD